MATVGAHVKSKEIGTVYCYVRRAECMRWERVLMFRGIVHFQLIACEAVVARLLTDRCQCRLAALSPSETRWTPFRHCIDNRWTSRHTHTHTRARTRLWAVGVLVIIIYTTLWWSPGEYPECFAVFVTSCAHRNTPDWIVYGSEFRMFNDRVSNRARQLYKNISMLFLFSVKDGKLSTGVNATFDASCYG